MKIILVGAGKVGYSLAQRLSRDDHDVIVIERDAERITILENNLDVSIVQGNGADPDLLRRIGLDDVGMLIAVTDTDEVNMLACLVAKVCGVPKTIARVRSNDYIKENYSEVREQLGVDVLINPEMVTAKEILQILDTPAALDVQDFANGKVRIIEVSAKNNKSIINKAIKDIPWPEGTLAVGILRQGRMLMPHGDSIIEERDNLFFLGAREKISILESWFDGDLRGKAERILIIGAGLIGRNLTVLLEEANYTVKVIEKDRARCELLASMVSKAMIICGDGTDADLLEEEEIGNNDVVICLTDDDKLNLLVALLAQHFGTSKTFVRVGRPEYITLMEQVGIDVVFSPRLLTSGEILRQVRMDGDIISITTFEGSKGEALEVRVSEDSYLVGKSLKQLSFPGKALVGAIVRGEETIVPRGDSVFEANDYIVIFTLSEYVTKVLNYINK